MTSFVLLHYLVFGETKKCVDSILNNVDGEKKVIVVDNCSPNDSFEKLCECYKGIDDVEVIQNSSNAGYASGINFGYSYAKRHYKNDFIVCMNNDMEIVQKDFVNIISASYEANRFYVLGPDVYSTSAKKHQNPESDHIRNLEEVERHIEEVKKIKANHIKLKIKGILRRIKPIKALYYKQRQETLGQERTSIEKNVTLHGSCLVFSKPFIEKREYALNPGTFFYCESQILDYECIRDNMLSIYDPKVKIFHHEDVATDAVAGSYEKKMIKKCERVLDSLEFMKAMMKKDLGK